MITFKQGVNEIVNGVSVQTARDGSVRLDFNSRGIGEIIHFSKGSWTVLKNMFGPGGFAPEVVTTTTTTVTTTTTDPAGVR